ncbi:MAG: bifunctional precorrin-2 dehydrogenase/sirohydrochlorin ferrochelatase [bacterium]
MNKPKGREPKFLPLFIDVRGKPCLVLGGGRVALRKVKRLLEAGAKVEVVSPKVCDSIDKLTKVGDLKVKIKKPNIKGIDTYISKYFLIIVATDDRAFNRETARVCRQAGALVNSATDPESGDVFFGAESGTGRLRFAVSTSGSSPLAARWFAGWAARHLPDGVDDFLEKLSKLRVSGGGMGEIGSRVWRKVRGLDWIEEIQKDGGRKIIGAIENIGEESSKKE